MSYEDNFQKDIDQSYHERRAEYLDQIRTVGRQVISAALHPIRFAKNAVSSIVSGGDSSVR